MHHTHSDCQKLARVALATAQRLPVREKSANRTPRTPTPEAGVQSR